MFDDLSRFSSLSLPVLLRNVSFLIAVLANVGVPGTALGLLLRATLVVLAFSHATGIKSAAIPGKMVLAATTVAQRIPVNSAKVFLLRVILINVIITLTVDVVRVHGVGVERVLCLHDAHDPSLRHLEVLAG